MEKIENSVANISDTIRIILPIILGVIFQVGFQGNDKRGQEMGVLTRNGYQIKSVRSHIYDLNCLGEIVFDKDLVEYEILTAKGNSIWILATHLQEQTEDKNFSDDTRIGQTEKIAEVYNHLYSEGKKYIAVVGKLNAVSYCYSLSPLLLKTNLKNVTKHPSFLWISTKEKMQAITVLERTVWELISSKKIISYYPRNFFSKLKAAD